MSTRLSPLRIVALVLLASSVVGCGPLGSMFGGDQEIQRERQQAQAALARWDAAVVAAGGKQAFVPVGELTGQIGDWEPQVGDNNKPALMSGLIGTTADLPGAAGEAEIRWADGTTLKMATISAEQALEELRATASPGCPECTPLVVTSARLSTAKFETSRGPASAPAWEFTVKGTNVVVTRIAVTAVSGIAVPPPPLDPQVSSTGPSIDSATGTVGGTQLTVAFVGAPETGEKPCGEDYTAEAVESNTAVVVIVIPHRGAFVGACSLVGARRTTTVELAQPLGDRAVLGVYDGRPVPVLLGP